MADLPWGPFPLEGQVEALLAAADVPDWHPTSLDRGLYLDLAEIIVRQALPWQDDDGCVIDPYDGLEPTTCTPRFVGAVAGLIGGGRCLELVPVAVRSFDWCVRELTDALDGDTRVAGSDFYTKELGWGFKQLTPHLDEATKGPWREALCRCRADDLYTDLISAAKPQVHNFNIYAMSGEAWRVSQGLADRDDAERFIADYLPQQWGYVTDYGMYRDPHDPLTYDLSVRQNLAMMLAAGYRGPGWEEVDELLRRGGLTTLLYVGPDGQAPFGGRSNQYHHMEGMIACVAEYEASRYAAQGKLELAGAFKHLARRSVASTARWLELTPFRGLKNAFDPVTRHGQDAYGQHSVYGLLCASLLGMAWDLADESIAEAPLPTDLGGGVLVLEDAFHKLFASAGGYHIAVDLRADLHYDATGLGRVLRRGVPAELGLNMPCCGRPSYRVCGADEERYAAIGPVWRTADGEWHSLAALRTVIDDVAVEVLEQRPERVRVAATWRGKLGGCREVRQVWQLDSGGVEVACEVDLDEGVEWAFEVPLLRSDGQRVTEMTRHERGFAVGLDGATYRVICVAPDDVRPELVDNGARWLARAANRNGIYNLGRLHVAGPSITVRLALGAGP